MEFDSSFLSDSSFLTGAVFRRLIQTLASLSLIGAVLGVGFILFQPRGEAAPEQSDRNWRFLFSCWAESVTIMVLYASVSFLWMFDRFLGFLPGATWIGDPYQRFASQYVAGVAEFIIDAMIMIVAVRLLYRIRRFLASG